MDRNDAIDTNSLICQTFLCTIQAIHCRSCPAQYRSIPSDHWNKFSVLIGRSLGLNVMYISAFYWYLLFYDCKKCKKCQIYSADEANNLFKLFLIFYFPFLVFLLVFLTLIHSQVLFAMLTSIRWPTSHFKSFPSPAILLSQ